MLSIITMFTNSTPVFKPSILWYHKFEWLEMIFDGRIRDVGKCSDKTNTKEQRYSNNGFHKSV